MLKHAYARIAAAIELMWRRRDVEAYVIRACINKLDLDMKHADTSNRQGAKKGWPKPPLKSVGR